MHEFVRQLQTACDQLELGEQPLLLAVSGGPDSIAMLRGCHELAQISSWQLAAAHLKSWSAGSRGGSGCPVVAGVVR